MHFPAFSPPFCPKVPPVRSLHRGHRILSRFIRWSRKLHTAWRRNRGTAQCPQRTGLLHHQQSQYAFSSLHNNFPLSHENFPGDPGIAKHQIRVAFSIFRNFSPLLCQSLGQCRHLPWRQCASASGYCLKTQETCKRKTFM